MSDPKPDDKFTLEEARATLKEQGYSVMKQDAFNRIIDEKHGEGFNKGKKDAETNLGEEQKKWKAAYEKLPNLEKKVSDYEKEKPDFISKSEHEQLIKVEQDKYGKAEERIQTLRGKEKENALLKAMGSKAIDSDAVLALSRDQFEIDDDGNVFPTDGKGGKLIDSEGHVTLDRYFDKFFKEKPYLAKGSDAQGAGSQSKGEGNAAGSQGKYTEEQLVAMSDEEFDKVGGLSALAQ